MSAVEVTISGVLYDKLNRTMQNVVLIGEASLTGLGVGGGPMPPGPGNPPGIWGPNDPRPTPPIAFPPGWVGGVPPNGGTSPGHPAHPIVLPGDPSWGDPHPSHPIVLPMPPIDVPPPEGTPDDDGFIKAPPEGGGWAYHEDYGWMYAPKPGDAQPHR